MGHPKSRSRRTLGASPGSFASLSPELPIAFPDLLVRTPDAGFRSEDRISDGRCPLIRGTEEAAKRVRVGDGRAQLALPKGRRHPVTMTSNALRKELFQLSVAERLELVEELWDSIPEEDEGLELTVEQRHDLDRRLVEADADPSAGAPWEIVRDRIRHRPR